MTYLPYTIERATQILPHSNSNCHNQVSREILWLALAGELLIETVR